MLSIQRIYNYLLAPSLKRERLIVKTIITIAFSSFSTSTFHKPNLALNIYTGEELKEEITSMEESTQKAQFFNLPSIHKKHSPVMKLDIAPLDSGMAENQYVPLI